MEKVIIVTFSWVFGITGKNRPALCLHSAVIHITIRFMNLKCNFPVVLGQLAPSTNWTVRESGKKMRGSLLVTEGVCVVCVYVYTLHILSTHLNVSSPEDC